MKKIIFKKLHRPVQLPAFLFPMGCLMTGAHYTIHRRVKFHSNCAYDLKNDKQKDWNKLFGVSFGLLGIHKNSARFGWRYNKDTQLIELCTIVYKDGFPERRHIEGEDLPLDQWVDMWIYYAMQPDGNIYIDFRVNGRTVNPEFVNTGAMMYFGCDLYFGGTSRAPHRMTVSVNRQ